MPTLDWIGKRAVLNHHREIPFHLLSPNDELSAGDPDAGNLVVQGDNLLALKALLPYYARQVKLIYIDPPYNTGNERWIYNDAVNSPQIREWLGRVVGAEGEDLSRHDKWLCMMYPRLMLLKDFLRRDGIVMVSIDDFEAHRLRCLMDEIFGPTNFIAQLVWDKTRKNDAKLFSVGHEYILVYARSLAHLRLRKTVWREQKPGAREIIEEWQRLKGVHVDDLAAIETALRAWYKSLPRNHPSKKLSRYKQVDQFGPWRDRDISWPGGGGPRYDVPHNVTGVPCAVPEAGWRFASPQEMQRQIALGLVVFREDHTKPPFRKAHLLPRPEELEVEDVDDVEAPGDDHDEQDAAGLQVMPSVIHKQAQVAVKLLAKVFGRSQAFPNPKDHEVLMRLIRYVTSPGDLVLDSFAGSGTTGHAVLQLNTEGGAPRRFVLVELDSQVARTRTAERLKRVVRGFGDVPGTGGGFTYCEVAEPLFDESGAIRNGVSYAELAQHVFFSETGLPLPSAPSEKAPLLGVHDGTAVYLLYNGVLGDRRPQGGNVLTSSILSTLPSHDGPKVIYAEGCRLGAARLERERIVFKQTPYDVRVG